MRKVYASDNNVILGHVRQVLENHAIGCVVRNDFLIGGAGEIPINETWPEVWVTDDRDFERARALVDAVAAEADASDPPWRCASCGELVEGQFTDCWRCGESGPEPGGMRSSTMGYTLERFAGDCRAALREQETMAAREAIRTYCSRACMDDGFVAAHFGPDNTSARRILYEDPEFGFRILSHVHEGPSDSRPHDHGPSWAVYSQVEGRTQMTDWRAIKAAEGDTPGVVGPVRTYTLERGDAHVYHEGDIHSPRSEGSTKLIRIEGGKMDGVPRGYFDPA